MITRFAIEPRFLLACALVTLSPGACDNPPTGPRSGFVKVSVLTTGGDPDDAFELVAASTTRQVPANGLTIISLPNGTHPLVLTGIADNCLVEGDAARMVNVENNDTTRVTFNILCTAVGRSGVIAFVEASKLIVMNADRSERKELNRGWHPSWSRDGTRLVYSAAECDDYQCTGSLGIVDPATREIITLPTTGPSFDPVWSPVDDVIAFSEAETGDLYLYDVATATRSKVALDREVRVVHPSWSPDGRQLVGSCYPGSGTSQICILNRDGTGIRYLTSDLSATGFEPSWSPDGNRIVFTRLAGSQGTITVVNADGTGLRALTAGRSPTWSPDSRQIIFSGDRGLYTIGVDELTVRRLTEGFHASPAWRP